MKIYFPKIIYCIAYALFIVSLLLFIFIFMGSMLAYAEHYFGWDIPLIKQQITSDTIIQHISIPLTSVAVQFPLQSPLTVFGMLAVFAYYAYYFFFLKSFIGVFAQEMLFTDDSLKKSRIFLWLNSVPILYWVVTSCYYLFSGNKHTTYFDEDFLVLIVHLLVMLVVYLCRIILKKGAALQQEQDYTI